MEGSKTSTRTLLAAVLAVSMVVPLSVAFVSVPAEANNCADGQRTLRLRAANPLYEQTSASEVLYFVAIQDDTLDSFASEVNGVDAHVVNLFCDAGSGTYDFNCTDNDLDLCQVSLRFYSATPEMGTLGETDCTRSGADSIPTGTHYIAVVLCEGLPAAGIDGALPFAARVTLNLDAFG